MSTRARTYVSVCVSVLTVALGCAQFASSAQADVPDPCVVPTPSSAPATLDRSARSIVASAAAMGASAYYNNGFFGKGVDVALIDSGVQPVPGVAGTNFVHGPDLSFEAMSPYAHVDTFGHGTHLAGIIAGNGPAFVGIAPAARVVSVKVADSVGVTDVTQVIAAIDWVVQHRHDDGLNIRVLNLSYGVAALDTWQSDALSFAVDQAWRAGIVVVAAAGNDGETSNGTRADHGLDAPAYNRNIIAVGSYDPIAGVALYSSSASSANKRMPDVVAPGTSILSLHNPGSTQDLEIADDCHAAQGANLRWKMPVTPDSRLVAGSGTSQATAMVSGAVALMLSKDAKLSPDTVKARLRADARTLRGVDNVGNQGEGAVDLQKVARDTRVAQSVGLKANETVSNNQTAHALDDARGGDVLEEFGIKLNGNRNIAGAPINVPFLENEEFATANLHATNALWVRNGTTESWIGGPFTVGTEFHARLLPSGSTPQLVLDDAAWPGTDFAGQPWGTHDWSTSPEWDGHKWRGDAWAVGSWFGANVVSGSLDGHKWRGEAWSSAYWGAPPARRSPAR